MNGVIFFFSYNFHYNVPQEALIDCPCPPQFKKECVSGMVEPKDKLVHCFVNNYFSFIVPI